MHGMNHRRESYLVAIKELKRKGNEIVKFPNEGK